MINTYTRANDEYRLVRKPSGTSILARMLDVARETVREKLGACDIRNVGCVIAPSSDYNSVKMLIMH